MLPVFLPLADVSVSAPGIGAVGFLIGFLIGLFGVGGGFLLIPMLKGIFRIPYPVAVGSGLAQIFINGAVAAWKHWRYRNVDLKLGLVMAAGSLVGTEIGVGVLSMLDRGGRIMLLGKSFLLLDTVLTGLFLVLLSLVSVLILIETSGSSSQEEVDTGLSRALRGFALPPRLSFPNSRLVSLSIWVPVSTSLIVGVLTGLMGVGGGFINLPLLVYALGVPTHVAVGTSAFNLLLASGYGALRHALESHVEPLLVGILFVGSMAGIQLGVLAARRLGGRKIRRYFALVAAVGIAVVLWDLYRELGS